MLEDEVYMVEAKGLIFTFFEKKVLMYDLNKKIKKEVTGYVPDGSINKVLVYNFGESAIFYMAHGENGFAAYRLDASPNLDNVSLRLLHDSDPNNDKGENIVDINLYEYKM